MATIEKKSIFHFRRKRSMVLLDTELHRVIAKQNLQAYLGTFRHKQAYPGIIQVYSKPSVTLAYLEP